ncbi:MAG: HAD-IIB family hydrolase [Planctomycetota bacterium]|nr:HAD-IIB family hydrolase [Planctomycetota bacterium]
MNGAPDLLVVDLDGTLLCPRGQVSESNRQALQAAQTAGVDVMVATGRTHAECGDILLSIEYEGPLVIASGAALVDWPSGRTLARAPLSMPDVTAVTEALQSHQCAALLLKDQHEVGYDYFVVGESLLHPVSRWWFELHGIKLRSGESHQDDAHPEHTLRVASIGEPDHMEMAARTVDERLGDRVFWRHWPAVGRQGERVHMLEVFAAGVDKWTMVKHYCQQRGFTSDRVAAIGDGLNDIQLLTQTGFGIAMENAETSVREAADAQTLCHSKDGVAHAVDRLLKGWS